MFVRDHLAVVAHWARGQLHSSVHTPAVNMQLKQLADAAEALRAQLEPPPIKAANVVSLDERRRGVC